MKAINKVSMVVLKILEIAHWIGSVSMIVAVVLCLLHTAGVQGLVETAGAEGGVMMNIYGFGVSAVDQSGALSLQAVTLFALASVFIFALMAMVFRNTYLIIRKSENTTPFQKDNIRMVREIGIFTIAVPIIGLIMSAIIRLVTGGQIEISVQFGSALIGIVALALTNVFAYGMELQNDVDGLV